MKTALIHDYIKEYGGAERVLEALHGIWPDATVFTLVYLPKFLGPHKERFKDWKIKTSFLQYLPFKEKLISPFRLIAPFVFKTFDLSNYDIVIISATGAYSPNMVSVKPTSQNLKFAQRPVHICYCHTPPRYLYGYATARDWKKNLIFRAIGEIGNHFLRLVDFKNAQNVDYFIANSKNVAGRIKKFYRRESTVIYPPVGTALGLVKNFSHAKAPRADSYFLAGGRLARAKHIDLIIQACQELNLPLKIFGRAFGGYDQEVENQNSKVDFLGEVTDENKLELMRNARAFIFAAEDEDFGITPVEAMSVGTPVIAYKSGGVVESVINGKTGIFFDELTVDSLRKAVEQLSNVTINPADCIRQAKKFSKENFKKEIKEFVERVLR